jgi:hypothetical protein
MDQLWSSGIPFGAVPPEVSGIFVQHGYLFGGFRSFPPRMTMPKWASGNIVLLVRDPRDMVVSLYFSEKYSHTPPGTELSPLQYEQFLEERAKSLSSELEQFCLGKAPLVSNQFNVIHHKLDGLKHQIYRYEDVIFEKRKWLDDMTDYLKLEVAEATIAAVAARHDIVPSAEDPFQHIRKVKPGDFREKLKPETISALSEAFAHILDRYGYDR